MVGVWLPSSSSYSMSSLYGKERIQKKWIEVTIILLDLLLLSVRVFDPQLSCFKWDLQDTCYSLWPLILVSGGTRRLLVSVKIILVYRSVSECVSFEDIVSPVKSVGMYGDVLTEHILVWSTVSTKTIYFCVVYTEVDVLSLGDVTSRTWALRH